MADLSRSHDRQVIESGKPLEVEETVVSEDGPRRYLSIRFPLNNAEDQPYAICDISTDITTYKALEEQLRQSQKMEALGRLSGGIAHDFNNLLTAIIGYSEFVLCKIDKSDPLCGYIGEIEKAGHRAAALTTQLLAFSRKQILQPQSLNLNVLVADLNKMLHRLISEDIELVTKLDADLELVKADQGHLEQVIINLAVNARDAMPQGGTLIIETANVQLNSEYASSHMGVAAGEYVMLAVSDTGSGMSKDTQARIFEPFFTTKEKGEGTGLGLSTVYGIVKQSGGHIWVYSEMDHGSTFKIYLPRSEGTAGTETVAGPAKAYPGSEIILLVEDAEPVRQLTRMILETNGYTVLEADCGKEALWQAQGYGGEIALLVTDVVMPEMSGIAVASTLGLTRPEMKVLYLSGYTEEVVNRHGLLNQGVAFLQKPFTPETLAREVRRVLEEA
jgi:two-component system cell cycle sensor histidine kinase/response regulator CckA